MEERLGASGSFSKTPRGIGGTWESFALIDATPAANLYLQSGPRLRDQAVRHSGFFAEPSRQHFDVLCGEEDQHSIHGPPSAFVLVASQEALPMDHRICSP